MKRFASVVLAACLACASMGVASAGELHGNFLQRMHYVTMPHDAGPVSRPAPRTKVAEDSCPSGMNYCGGGLCCEADKPHLCPQSRRCYKYYTDAQADCGNAYIVCGRSGG